MREVRDCDQRSSGSSRFPPAVLARSVNVLVAALVVSAVASGMLVTASPATARDLPAQSIGSLAVRSCRAVELPQRKAWCGSVTRPWGVSSGTLKVGFTVVTPAGADLRSLTGPPIVAMEGGPGYSAIDSAQGFAEMLGPVLDDRVLVVMDARGTGRSAAIECPSMAAEGNGSVAECGRYLGSRIGGYSSAAAADDLAALLEGLALGPPVIYGDSYGTFLAQVYAVRHPVVGLILDGAYPISGEDAWYATQGLALRKALDLVCSRSPTCAPGQTTTRLQEVLDRVRRKPVRVKAPGADDRIHTVTVDGPALVEVAFNGTYLTPTMRELDAALASALDGDWLPLGRLVAEFDFPGGDPQPTQMYSQGLALAVSCHDYPRLFTLSSSAAARRTQIRAAIARKVRTDAQVYAPFTIREYLRSDWAEQQVCLPWPLRSIPPGLRPGSLSRLPDVPALVISGDLDTITTAYEGQMVADAFPQGQHLIVSNGLHVNALGSPDGCAAAAARTFIGDLIARREPGVVAQSCALPPIQQAAGYPRNRGTLSVGEALAQTVADVLDRALQTMGDRGRGLRGGRWSLQGWPQTTITMQGVRLYEDLPVDGSVEWDVATGAVRARLQADGQDWSGCWQAQDGFGPGASARIGSECEQAVPTLAP